MNKIISIKNPIVLVSLLAFLAGAYLIYMARNQSFDNSENRHSLGFVGQALEDVRLKRQGNMHWYVAQEEQKLFQGDLIFTGDKSKTILMLDQGELTLGDYTMVIIHPGFIQVESGEIELKANKPTMIRLFGEEVRVSAKTATTIINRPNEKAIRLSKVDEDDSENRKVQDVLKEALAEKVAEVAPAPVPVPASVPEVVPEVVPPPKPEIVQLQILGLLPVWEPEKVPMKLTFESSRETDLVKVSVRNPLFEKLYENKSEIELKDLPAGKYTTMAQGFKDGELVSKSEEQGIEVVIPIKLKELGAPKIKNKKDKVSL